ncbi:hypothetical protein Krac_6562 [Ktedonobacter racemifer DSM 44963]|uniref:Uncharacterized protein n=1 Tax=Ktedonobacter racemifer DSM 44963 TaxID=485913 RepID=D6TVF3_KTERA|nr:hypothetical protein Krac_6562 [Ktedonobacter racemifer DSM 44963]
MHAYVKKRNPPGKENSGLRLWLRRYRWIVLMISLIITLTLLGFMVQPVYFAVTHSNELNCGGSRQVEVFRSYPKGNPAAINAATCFFQAHQQCRAATMYTSSMDPSGGSTRTFYTANNLGSCSLSIEIDVRSFDGGGTTIRRLDCMSLLHKSDGLHFLNCRDVHDEVFSYAF